MSEPAGEAHARRDDPWTSHAAARSIPFEQLRASQRAVYDCFKANGPMHHNRLVEVYAEQRTFSRWPRQSVSGLRTRTSELVDAGWLRNSGQIVVLLSNRKSIVWEVDDRPEPPAVTAPVKPPQPPQPPQHVQVDLLGMLG